MRHSKVVEVSSGFLVCLLLPDHDTNQSNDESDQSSDDDFNNLLILIFVLLRDFYGEFVALAGRGLDGQTIGLEGDKAALRLTG